jgi:hypothetical protein
MIPQNHPLDPLKTHIKKVPEMEISASICESVCDAPGSGEIAPEFES